MEKGSLQIHSENILPIIKKWLYSDKDIFVRELVSNACDAIQKVKILRDEGQIEAKDEDFRIDIQIDTQNRTLKFIDNGIGMDAEEVKKYIAQIAFSGAEEFLSKYQSNKEADQFIGHFGLGFYSAYMVADQVEINTLSYKAGAEPVLWICDGSSDYEIDRGTRQTRGTEITLFIGEDHEECLDKGHMEKTLRHYCSFLPYPIYLDGKRINDHEPLWTKPASECTQEDYLQFYRYLYPFEEDPLFWVHLNVDYPFNLKGILYFPKIKRDFDINKSGVSLYCNRVFVSDNCKDLIPNYLTVLKGIIDSPDIPLNVSRSYLQMDRTVRQLANHISKKVADSLSALYKTDRERFIRAWQDVSMIAKLGILEDEKFYERAKEFLIWQDTDKQWTTVNEYLERNREKTGDKILYTIDEKHAGHMLTIYRQQGAEILCANSPLDPYLMQFLENKLSPVTFQRIDAEVHENLVDKSREKTILDAEGKTEAARLADFVRAKLGDDLIDVQAKSLATDDLPGIIVLDEKQRRMRDYLMRLDPEERGKQMPFLSKRTFVVNTNSPLMTAIQKLDNSKPDLAKDLMQEVYELALLSQREMEPHALSEFISRSMRILETLTKEAVKGI
ncbi:molecular chaperone HtpG [Candidatus Protochlamydia phocaeensis]|uniref:molecular chaperone HtpG n=1 Tax=Candidatus Protochlamydia phocaeensis TaxID=1414722 RepID=UPI000837F895|nr:molecular chaperone HtpG [Candidatus Protochlamydia phocaeensis]